MKKPYLAQLNNTHLSILAQLYNTHLSINWLGVLKTELLVLLFLRINLG